MIIARLSVGIMGCMQVGGVERGMQGMVLGLRGLGLVGDPKM